MDMFSSNQLFVISGEKDDENQIKMVFDLLINGYGFKPKQYCISDFGVIYMYPFETTHKKELNGVSISEKNCNSTYLTQVLRLHFCSENYDTALNGIEYWESDGCVEPGWKIEYITECGAKVLVISPYWCFYSR